MKFVFGLLSLVISINSQAAVIGILDSGVDYKHESLSLSMWENKGEVLNRRDDDGNGYQDDIYGWNFANQNQEVIDYKFLGTFSRDPYKYFEIQGRMFMGTMTDEDRAWLQAKRVDKKFMQEMQLFGNFVHGTHVAGIAAAGNMDAQIMALKLIPTQASPFIERAAGQVTKSMTDGNREKILKSILSALAGAQSQMMEEIGFYLSLFPVDIVNGSFGTSFTAIKPIISMAYKVIFFKTGTDEELAPYINFFIEEMLKGASVLVNYAPKTLFVFAAGNDGQNNDIYGTSPANLRMDNVISVAATFENQYLAPFSNFGKKVDVAAPGMLIESSIPGNEYLKVSGTSQAAPYVANVAAQIKDANPQLGAKEIKNIIMSTVDKKSWLAEAVSTGGIVNYKRAVLAAEYAQSMPVEEAIMNALKHVKDVPPSKNKIKGNSEPMRLYPQFE
ncbi:MAG: S8 family serine peptidase [Bacteriovoracaceae bacterium]|nr:S8 family serine peptidase [Bacteriovoracaceae bacterium]